MTRVLGVDDEEQIPALIQRVAEDLGFATHTLSDPRRFMTTFFRLKPHIVVVDIIMPDMDDIEIIQKPPVVLCLNVKREDLDWSARANFLTILRPYYPDEWIPFSRRSC